MTSFGYRSNPRYMIKECSSCGTLYTRDCGCSKGNVEDKILVPKPPKNCARCTRCGYLVDDPNCYGYALLRQKLEENLVIHSPDFQNTSEPSNASTNVVNAPRELYVVKQDHEGFVAKIICDLNRAPDSPNQFHCFHCKDVLRDGEACKQCTCAKCRSGLGKGLCYICGHNQNSLNDSPSISETSSQSPPNINHCCYECGDPLDGIFCKQCTSESPFTLDSTPTYVDESPNVFNPPPQPLVYPSEFCWNDAYYGHYCTPQAPFIYPEPCYNQNFNFSQDFQNVLQQYPCCDDCGVTHDAYQCQPMNEVYYYGQNSCYDYTSIGFDQYQPQQYTVDHPIFNAHNDYLDSQIQLNNDNIFSGLPSFSAITPVEPALSTEEPNNSLSMGDEHLDTIPATESDEFIKSSVENLIPIPSESEGIPDHMCDVLSHDNSPPRDISKDQFEDFFESNEEFSSTDDDSFSFDKIDYVEALPPDSELVSSKVMEIVTPKVGGIKASIDNLIPFYDPIISGTPPNLTLSGESDFFLEADMLLLEAFLNDDHSSKFKTKSSSTSLNSLLEETNNFNNSLPEFTTFSKVLFDAEYESNSSDDQSCSDEDVLEKMVSKPLSEEEIIPMKSLRTHDSSLPISSKIDFLLDEFAGELTFLKSIPPGIDEANCDFEEDIRLIEKFLYDNSSLRPSEEFVSVNSDAASESFSPSPNLVKDSDSLMKEIDLFCTPDYPMPPELRTRIMTLKGIF
nr:hypothetical protein [Tanacetum cinerariifolium]